MKLISRKQTVQIIVLVVSVFYFSCNSRQPEDRLLVIPLKTGLAKNNGATPWYAELSIGTGNKDQLFKLIMDTGTSSTWITSDTCTTNACKHHRRYNPDLSATHRWVDTVERNSELGPWGAFRFKVGADQWNFMAGRSLMEHGLEKIRVPKMQFLQATNLIDGKNSDGSFNSNWDDLVQDGSLAFPSTNTSGPSTQILELLLKENLIDQKIMSYWTSQELNRGEVILGGIDTDIIAEETLHYFPVVRNIAKADHSGVLWTIGLHEIRVGEETVHLPDSSAVLALDTGSSRFKGDPEIIGNIRDLISEDGSKPCTIKSSERLINYPDLTFVLRDQSGEMIEFIIKASDYFQTFPDSLRLAFHPLYPTPSSSTTNMLLAGSVFLDHYYVVFDYTTVPMRVGIAHRENVIMSR